MYVYLFTENVNLTPFFCDEYYAERKECSAHRHEQPEKLLRWAAAPPQLQK